MHEPTMEELQTDDAPILVAILIAARKTRNRLLETIARRELESRHKVLLRFLRDPVTTEAKGGHANG